MVNMDSKLSKKLKEKAKSKKNNGQGRNRK